MFRRHKLAPIDPTPERQRAALDALPIVPFDLATCTLLDPPTAEEQAGFDAHVRACPTREDFWNRAPSADWMLDLLRRYPDWIPVAPEAQLRRFALKCVEGLDDTHSPALDALLETVKRRISGNATLKDLEDAQEKSRAFVTPGGLQGLPRCIPHAAAALAAWHTATPNPYQGAFWTAEFAARHDAFAVVRERARWWKSPEDRGESWRQSWHAAFFVRANPQVYREALWQSRGRQADILRSILPHPFAPIGQPVRAEVYLQEQDDSDNLRVYCVRCGTGIARACPGVLFDARGMACAGCGQPLRRVS